MILSLSFGLLSATSSVSVVNASGVILFLYNSPALFKKPNKGKSAAALVAVSERVIFHHKIQKVCGFFFYRFVGVTAKHLLKHIAHNAGYGVFFPFLCKKFRGLFFLL